MTTTHKTQDFYQWHELQWQLCTRTGNLQMQAKLYQEAQQPYKQALELAHLLLEAAKTSTHHPEGASQSCRFNLLAMAAYVLQAFRKNVLATLRCSPS